MQEESDRRGKFSISKLEKLSYRNLQQHAKALHLPSNYKKKYLIQLIHAKYFGTQEQIEGIIQLVMRERQELQLAQGVSRTRKLQAAEISSTSESTLQSPPMAMSQALTPVIVRYSPNLRRNIFSQDLHKPQAVAKAREVFSLKDDSYNSKNPPEATGSSHASYEAVPGTSYKIKRPTTRTCRTSFKSTYDKAYRPSTTIAAVKTYLMQKSDTGRVLRNRTCTTVNRYRLEKYKDEPDDTESNYTNTGKYKVNAVPVKYEVVPSTASLTEKYNGNTNQRSLPVVFIDSNGHCSDASKRYKMDGDGKYTSNSKEDVQRSKKPVSDGLQTFIQSKEFGSQVSLVPTGQSLIKHSPSILDVGSNVVQRSVERAKVVRKLDEKFDCLQGIPNNDEVVQTAPAPRTSKRERTISGIYPIEASERKPTTDYHYVPSGMGIRKADGTISKIKALVRKPLQTPLRTYKSPKQLNADYEVNDLDTKRPIDCNLQDVITKTVSTAYNIEKQFDPPTEVTSQMMQNYTTTRPNYTTATSASKAKDNSYFYDEYTTYCHKKIRSEQVRTRRESAISRKETQVEYLPRIHEVFSSFSNVEVMEPIFVQVGRPVSPYPLHPTQVAPTQPQIPQLETLYNLRTVCPATLTATATAAAAAAATYCVYATPIITTAKAQTSNFAPNAQCHDLHKYQAESLANDYPNMSFSYAQKDNSHSTTSSLEVLASQVGDKTWNSSSTISLDTAESIPDMVEDALELISQDGDYMERIEMDEGMQCVLCTWTGSRFYLEDHIRQSLYCDEDAFQVATLTACNKVNGEQYSWTGLVPALAPLYPLEPSLETETHKRGLQIPLSDLGLDFGRFLEHVFITFYVQV